MVRTAKSGSFSAIVIASAVMLVWVSLTGCKKKPSEPTEPVASPNDISSLDVLTPASGVAEAVTASYEPPVSLQNVIKAAKTWDASFRPYWGKIARDFTLTDIDGQVHTLSGYRGRNVVVVIWRTWNSTCKLQVPQLKELRAAFEDKDLAILAISDEPAATLKAFAGQEGINYTVLTSSEELPAPFVEAQYAPGSFFIDPQGKFKLAATGLVPPSDAAAIIRAQ
jgi:peroxiredoxin